MEDMEQKPTFVYRDGMQPSAQYVEWLSDVKARFSYSNVKYVKRWYLFYYERIVKGQQLADQIENGKSHQLGDQLEMPEIFCERLLTAPWQNWN